MVAKSMKSTSEPMVQQPQNLLPIERPDTFPVEELGQLVKVEGRGPEVSRPPLYLHKWWARRFGSVFRSILLGVLLDAEDDIWEGHYRAHNFAEAVVLDPFMGSGTTLFEAARLGAKVVGCDINPVAWWTARMALSQPASWSRLEETFNALNLEAQTLFSAYYQTYCQICSEPRATTRHVRWARVLPCGHCGQETALMKSYILGKYKRGRWLLCRECGFVYWTSQSIKTGIACPQCEAVFDPAAANAARGQFICAHCHRKTDVRKAMTQLTNPTDHAKMFAVLYDCPEHGWGLCQPTEKDLENYHQAITALRDMEPELAIPAQRIRVEGRTDPRPANYGYRFWRQMFTPRQLLVLGWLAARVRDLPADVKEPFATMVSQLTNYTNAFCVPRPNRPAAISWIFRMHAFVPPTDFVESNPLGGRLVSGTFQSLFWRSTRAAYQFRRKPAERQINAANVNQSVAVPIPGERVQVTLAEDWNSLIQTPHSAWLLCQPSDKLPLPDRSVSHIITDPPFYDNVAYGELSEFNYVWLHEMLGDYLPEFSRSEVRLEKELIVSKRIGKDDEFYAEGMAAVFAECYRVLTDHGVLAFTFHHRSRDAWETLLHALLKAGFCVSAIHPVRSESDRSLHIMTGDSIEHDVVIICRKATDPRPILWDDLVEQMRRDAQVLIHKLDPTHRQSNSNVSILVFGQCLKLFSEHHPEVYKLVGKVSISEALYTAEQIAKLITQSSHQQEG
ncbi:MAG: DNA methyltransferase [Anaerolineae bacterium]